MASFKKIYLSEIDQKLKADKKNSSTVTQFLDPSLIGLVTFDCIKRITAKKLEHFFASAGDKID